MSEFNLDDALGQGSASGQSTQSQGQNWNNPWGGQNPAQQNPGGGFPGFQAPGQGQPFPGGYPAPGQGQPFPGGYPAPGQGQPFPGGYPAPGQGQPYSGGYPAPDQQYPGGYPAPPPGQQYPAGGQIFPGYPGGPTPGQPTDPKMAGPTPSAPTAPAIPAGPLKLPYIVPCPGGMQPGMMMTVQGSVNHNAKRFTVDIKKGDDICLHVNPRFDENPNCVVRNTMTRNVWGPEERGAPKFPFQRGGQFKIQIRCEQEGYSIAINGEMFCQYKHRDRSLQQINAMCVSGDITLNQATVGMM